MEVDPESDPNRPPSTNSDDWVQRAIQAQDFDCYEAALIGLPAGSPKFTNDMENVAARVHRRAANRVDHCLETGLQREP